MAINPRDLLENGREMARRNLEVDHRNGASRAYYAAFHACRALLDALGVVANQKGRGSHRDMADTLMFFPNQSKNLDRTNINRIRTVGKDLSPLINKRRRADYDIKDNFPSSDAFSILITSSKIIDNVEKLLDMVNSSSASNSNK